MNAILWWMFQNTASLIVMVPLAWLVCRCFSRQPAVQHLVWLVILMKFSTPPLVAWPVNLTELQQTMRSSPVATSNSLSMTPDDQASSSAPMPSQAVPLPPQPLELNTRALLVQSKIESATDIKIDRDDSVTQVPVNWRRRMAIAVFVIWLAGALISFVRQVQSLVRHANRVNAAKSAPARLVDELAIAAAHLKITPPEVVVLPGITSPFVWCLGRTRIVWPEEMLAATDTRRFRGIMAHELAHLQRRDHWVAWLELAASIVWWWNPLFWFVRRRLRDAAEMSCDAAALETELATRQEYAEILLELSTGARIEQSSSLIVGAGSVVTFERRLTMILADHVSSRVPRRSIAVVLGLALLVVPCWSLGEPPKAKPKPQDAAPVLEATAIPVVTTSADKADQPDVSEDSNADDETRDMADEPVANVSGKVVDPEGRPIQEATILQGEWGVRVPRIAGKTDSDGKYRVQVKGYRPWLVAIAPGFGFGTPVSGDETTIKLVLDVPVKGRVVDKNGKPLAGAKIRVRDVHWPWHPDDPVNKLKDEDDRPKQRPKDAGKGLDPWLVAVRRAVNSGEYGLARHYLQDLIGNFLGNRPAVYATMISPVTTDADGRFTLRGIGAERVAELYVDGLADYASSLIVVVTREIEQPIDVPYEKPEFRNIVSNPKMDLPVYGASFQTALEPGRVFEGVVTDRETGSPVAGVNIIGDVITSIEYPGYDRFFATTDQKGHYRIEGYPTGLNREFVVEVPNTLSYFGRQIHVRLDPGEGSHRIDIPLAKCLWITGRVIDAATGSGVSGATIEYHTFNKNPHLQKDLKAGYVPQFGPDHHAEYTDENGKFRIRGYPGRGIVTSWSHEYLQGIGADSIPGLKRNEYMQSLFDVGGFSPDIRSTTIEVNIPDDAETFDCEVKLLKGKSRTVIVAWPDDKVLGNLEASGLNNQVQNPMTKLNQSQFEVNNLFSKESREVVARYVPAKLTGMAVVTEADDGPVTLNLVPWATLSGRLIDENGQPLSQGFRIQLQDYKLPLHTVNGRNYDKEDFGIDADGRFLLIGLVPGAKYRLRLEEGSFTIRGDLTDDLTLEPGENRDLGDVKVTKKDKPAGQ